MAQKSESMPTQGNMVTAPTGSQARSMPMHVYSDGEHMGEKKMMKGAEMMKGHSMMKDQSTHKEY